MSNNVGTWFTMCAIPEEHQIKQTERRTSEDNGIFHGEFLAHRPLVCFNWYPKYQKSSL